VANASTNSTTIPSTSTAISSSGALIVIAC
jgi:hypothetical protein